jgi:hypothetical protein
VNFDYCFSSEEFLLSGIQSCSWADLASHILHQAEHEAGGLAKLYYLFLKKTNDRRFISEK